MELRAKYHNIITWLVVLTLLVLRILILPWIPIRYTSSSVWVNYLYEIGTYALIIFLIFWEWKDLQSSFINPLSILILIAFPFLSKIILHFYTPEASSAFPRLMSFPFFILGLILIYGIIKRKLVLKERIGKDLHWFTLSAILGILVFSLEGFLMIRFMNFPKNVNPGLLALSSPFYQLGYAASPEEPLFRGFLWGILRKMRINNIWILVIQAFLFMLGHLFYLKSEHPIINLSFIFMNAIIMGVLAWRTRAISSSMAFHAFSNGSSIFQYWIYFRLS